MTDSDKPKFVAVLTELALLKPGTKLTTEAHRAWWNALREKWTLEEFQRAAAHLRDTIEFMPNPFHFDQLRRATRRTAVEAWDVARQTARRAISCGRVMPGLSSGDPVIDQAVGGIGGYGAIALSETTTLQFLEKRFATHYAECQDTADTRAAVPQLGRQSPSAAFSNAKGVARR